MADNEVTMDIQDRIVDTPTTDENVSNPEMVRRPLILFSGGYDSTYLVQLALEEGDCDVLSVVAGQHRMKNIQEYLSREKLMSVFKTCNFKGRIVNQYTFELPLIEGASLSQPPAWLVAALWKLDPGAHSEVRIGYVLGDEVSAFLGDLQIAWDALIRFTRHYHQVPVVFPLYLTNKKEIYTRLHPSLLKHIWVCELPETVNGEIVRCGKCAPCCRHEAVIQSIAKQGPVPFQPTISAFDIEKAEAEKTAILGEGI